MFGNHTRVFGFANQVFSAARKKPVLFAPLALNIGLAVPVNALLILVSLFVSDGVAMMLMPVGLTALYFIDYFAGGLNTAMVYDEQSTGNATLGGALKRTLKSAIGILIFAVVSGLLDFAVQVLSQRRLHMLRPLLQIVRSFWSTATFVIMPAMIIEGLSFGDAFKRSKQLAENDPTQIGIGYIGIGIVTSLISFGGFVLVSIVGGRILMPISPLLGIAFSLIVVNATWAIAAYLKSTYYTCFYMWTRECERNRGVNPAFAPAPLRNVLADVDFASMGVQLAPAAAAVAMGVGVGMMAPATAQAGFAPQPGFGAPQAGFVQPQQGGFAQPQQAGGFAQPQQPGGFAQPQQPGGFAQPQQPQFGQPPQQQPQFGQPPQQQFAQPQQPQFGQPPQQQAQFGQPPQQFAQPQQPQFGQPPQQQFAQPQQPGGFAQPQQQPQFGQPPQQQFAQQQQQQQAKFVAPQPQPQQAQFVAPQPQAQFVAPQPQQQQFVAPQPQQAQFVAPQPPQQPQSQFVAPQPQQPQRPAFVAPGAAPSSPQAQTLFIAPGTQPAPQPPAPQPPAPQPSAPPVRAHAYAPTMQAASPQPPAPRPSAPQTPQYAQPQQPQYAQPQQPQYAQPQQPQYAQPQQPQQPRPQAPAQPAYAQAPVPQSRPQAAPPAGHEAYPSLDDGDIQGEATVVAASPFDDDDGDATRVR